MARREDLFRFDANGWGCDAGLRMCSLEARGFWLECQLLMAKADPPGHLLLGWRAPTDKELGRITGTTARRATRLLAELERAGVFNRTDSGVVCARRMHIQRKTGRKP